MLEVFCEHDAPAGVHIAPNGWSMARMMGLLDCGWELAAWFWLEKVNEVAGEMHLPSSISIRYMYLDINHNDLTNLKTTMVYIWDI